MTPAPVRPERPRLARLEVDATTTVAIPGFYTTGSLLIDTRIFYALTLRFVKQQAGVFS